MGDPHWQALICVLELAPTLQIAAKVEIHVGMLPEGTQDPAAAQWKRLGHLSFDPNERSQLSARELKSVVLSGVPAQLVRFQIARCHMNQLNVYGQVRKVQGGLWYGQDRCDSPAALLSPLPSWDFPRSPLSTSSMPCPPFANSSGFLCRPALSPST
jgi:hypothetical protein